MEADPEGIIGGVDWVGVYMEDNLTRSLVGSETQSISLSSRQRILDLTRHRNRATASLLEKLLD